MRLAFFQAVCYFLIMKQGYTYILFNQRNGTLYVGVTSDLVSRIYEHKTPRLTGLQKNTT